MTKINEAVGDKNHLDKYGVRNGQFSISQVTSYRNVLGTLYRQFSMEIKECSFGEQLKQIPVRGYKVN